VPMNPEFLPEFALLIAGVIAGAFGLHLLFTKQPSRAMRAGAVGLACIALAFVSGIYGHKPPGPHALLPAAKSSMSLVLGDVVLRVTPSDRYVLSVDDKQYLDLDLRRAGLKVTCVVGAHDSAAAAIHQNSFPFRRSEGIRPAKPDDHTLLVQEEDKDIFRIHYSEPRRIEVTGQFFEQRSADSTLISLAKGIRWSGGSVPPGTVIDLRSQGKGRIDFGRSGLIRILPHK